MWYIRPFFEIKREETIIFFASNETGDCNYSKSDSVHEILVYNIHEGLQQKYCPSSCTHWYTVKEMEVFKMFFRIVSPTQLTFIKCWLIVSLRKQLLIGWKFVLTNQEYYPDLGNDASSVWNFCGRESQCWRRRKISLSSQASK